MTTPASVSAACPVVTVELLYFDGCPNYQAYLPRLRALLPDSAELILRPVTTDEDARRLRFLGSPSVRVEGRDVELGSEERADYGLLCRLYRTAGGWSGTPSDEWVLNAVRQPGATLGLGD